MGWGTSSLNECEVNVVLIAGAIRDRIAAGNGKQIKTFILYSVNYAVKLCEVKI